MDWFSFSFDNEESGSNKMVAFLKFTPMIPPIIIMHYRIDIS